MRTRSLFAACTVALTLSSSVALAEDRTGAVTEIRINATNYMALRVKLAGVTSFCSGGATDQHIAYLAADQPHHRDVLRILMAAKAAGKEVTVKSTKNGSYCRIEGVTLLD